MGTYEKLRKDTLSEFIEESNLIVAQVEGILSKTKAAIFRKPFFQVPYLYHLAKIHKDINNPMGRPTVAFMDSITTSYSLYIDHLHQPLTQALPSFIWDGTHLIELLCPCTWESSYLWVSLNICSLYTSITHNVGLQAVAHFLDTNPTLNTQQIDFILLATKFCLERNYFLFDGDFYLQKQGTAMGTNFSPSYANLTMGLWKPGVFGLITLFLHTWSSTFDIYWWYHHHLG